MSKKNKKKLTINDFRSEKPSLKETIKPVNWHKALLGNILKLKDLYTNHIASISEKISKSDYLPNTTSIFACFHPIATCKSLFKRVQIKIDNNHNSIRNAILNKESISPYKYLTNPITVLRAYKERFFPPKSKHTHSSKSSTKPKENHRLFANKIKAQSSKNTKGDKTINPNKINPSLIEAIQAKNDGKVA